LRESFRCAKLHKTEQESYTASAAGDISRQLYEMAAAAFSV